MDKFQQLLCFSNYIGHDNKPAAWSIAYHFTCKEGSYIEILKLQQWKNSNQNLNYHYFCSRKTSFFFACCDPFKPAQYYCQYRQKLYVTDKLEVAEVLVKGRY